MLWSRKWQPAPIFLSGKFHGQRILAGFRGFPGGSDGKESACNAGDLASIPGVGRSSREGNLPTPVFLPGKFHGQKSLAGYSPWGRKESDILSAHTHTSIHIHMICLVRQPQMAQQLVWGYHLVKVYDCRPPCSALGFLFLFYSMQIGEVNGNIIGTTTPASFKPVMVALIS